jgi:MFS transporter, FSR family, fosmidomycin resistance protein
MGATPAPVALRQDARVIGLVGLAHASSHFAHLLLPPLFPVFQRDFGLSYSELGLLMSMFFVVSGLGQASAGFLVDRVGPRPVLFAALGVFVLACLLASTANSYPALLAVAALAGLGNSPFHPVDFTILNQRVSSDRLGYAFSAHGLTGNLGWAAAPVFLVGLGAVWGWRTAYVGAAVMYGVVLVLLLLNRDALKTDAHRSNNNNGAADPLANGGGGAFGFMRLPVVWWCFAFFLLSTMTLAVVQSFAVSILREVHGVSVETATLTLTAYMLCAAAGMLGGGFVAARAPLQSDRTVAICMGAGAVLLAVCATGWLGARGTMVVLAITGFAIGVGGPSRDMMIKRATPKGATGRVYGMVYSGLDVGFALSPLVFGGFMDKGWYGATLGGAALVLLLSVGVALGVGRRTEVR